MYLANNTEKYLDSLKKLIIFRFLNDQELTDILELCEIQVYEDGETVVHEGEVDQSFYAVISGCTQVTVKENNKEVYISTIGEGEIFGEAGMFIRVKRTANILTSGEAVLLKIKRDGFMKFVKKYPSSGNKLLMVVVYSLLRKLRSANQELAFERRSDVEQDDIDSIIDDLTG